MVQLIVVTNMEGGPSAQMAPSQLVFFMSGALSNALPAYLVALNPGHLKKQLAWIQYNDSSTFMV